MKKFLFTIGLLAVSFATLWGQFKYVKVDAPFSMKPIKEFIYPDQDFSIVNYGAVKGGEADVSDAIAGAITACNQAGGGRVVIPEGEWLTGPIHLKSNVNLYLAEGAVLRFTDNPSHYLPAVMTSWEGMECYNYSPLIYAFECKNVAITGTGMLSPKMNCWKKWFARPKAHMDALRKLYTMASKDVPVEKRQMAVGENHLRPHLIHLHDCKVPQSVRRLFFVKTNHRRGAFVENIHMENIRTGHVQRVLEIDTDVLYQWRELVPTYEERITRIDGIYLKNVICESADAIYELKGDAKLPVRNVVIKDVHVDKVNDFVKKVHNVKNVKEDNVTYGSLH